MLWEKDAELLGPDKQIGASVSTLLGVNLHHPQIRLAIIGTGFGAYGLAPAFRRDSRFDVVAICSTSTDRARMAADRLGVGRACGNYRELLREGSIDAVAVATPPAVQGRIVLDAVRQRKHVFAEKPLAIDMETARLAAEAAADAGVANMVDFLFPEVEAWSKALDLVKDGQLGRIRHACVTWFLESYDNRKRLAGWKTDAGAGGGVLQHFGSHTLYYLERFLGPAVSLAASLSRAPDIGRPAETFAALFAEFECGASASATLSNAAIHGSGHRFELYGTLGAAMLANTGSDHVRGFRLFHGSADGRELSEVELSGSEPQPAGEDARVLPVSLLARRFADWVISGVPARPSFHDGVRVQALVDAARRSSASGQRVAVAPARDPRTTAGATVPSPAQETEEGLQ